VSGKVTGWFLRRSDGPDDLAYRMVLVAMCDLADPNADNIRAASRLVADLAHLSQWYTRELIGRAIEEGWLEVTQPGDRRRPTVYRVPRDRWTTPPSDSGQSDVMRGARTRITASAEESYARPQGAQTDGPMRGTSAHMSAARERAQSAAHERASTSLRGDGYSAGPRPTPHGDRAGADGGPAGSGSSVARGEEVRTADKAAAVNCPNCDDYGWSWTHDGRAYRCDHSTSVRP
jgi:hypothetical protein